MFIGGFHTQKQWRTDGGFEGSRRTEIPNAIQRRANLNQIVKNVKSFEFGTPTLQDLWKTAVKF
jgi:hypothetical protein